MYVIEASLVEVVVVVGIVSKFHIFEPFKFFAGACGHVLSSITLASLNRALWRRLMRGNDNIATKGR